MSNDLWNVELHSHTRYSLDCLTDFESIIRACEARGIDKIAITDHNTAAGALKFKELAPELVIVGEEIFTTQGELLAYFIEETVPHGLTPDETIERLRDQNAVISVSHPFDINRKGAWKKEALDRIIDRVDAVEVFNARCLTMGENAAALAYAQQHNLCGTVGSDAHTLREYGRAYLQMQPFINADEFRAALQTATPMTRLSPFFVHFGSTFAKWSRKLRITTQPR
jgi:hypothetical protein